MAKRAMLIVAIAALHLVATEATCRVLEVNVAAGPAAAEFEFTLHGSGLNGTVTMFKAADPAAEVVVQAEAAEEGRAMHVTVPANSLDAGNLYGVSVRNEGATICESQRGPFVFAHGGVELAAVELDVDKSHARGPRGLNAAGKDIVRLLLDDGFNARTQDIVVEISGGSGDAAWTLSTGGQIRATPSTSQVFVEMETPAVPVPDDWVLACEDPERPVKGGACVPDLPATIRVSLDAGRSFSSTHAVTFEWLQPVRLAFLFKSTVNDFGWSSQVNDARLQLESIYGATVHAATYLENVPEGHWEGLQENKGQTFLTETPVPEFVTEEDGTTRPNVYYQTISIMKKLCDEDYDMVVPTTYGHTKPMRDMADYRGCLKTGDGSASDATNHVTHFVGAGTGYQTATLHGRAYGKALQARYLSGLTVGFELKRRRTELELAGELTPETMPCVTFLQAGGWRGLNAFAIGCREANPDCLIKSMFMKDFYNPAAERDASAFAWHINKCHVIVQHTDSPEPQFYFKEVGGLSIGYNFDQRSLLGDSVLTSEQMVWTPMFEHFVNQIKAGTWTGAEDLYFGLDKGAVDLAPYFSPLVPQHVQAYVLRRKAELAKLEGDDAMHAIFCGAIKKRYLISERGCSGRDEFVRQSDEEMPSLSPASDFMWDKNGNPLPANATVTDTDCLTPEAAIANHKFLVDGIEIWDGGIETPFGSVVGSVPQDTPEDECPSGYGHGFFVPPHEFPRCDGSQWRFRRGECNPDTMRAAVVYEWIVDNVTGNELRCGDVADVAGKYSVVAELPFLADGPPCDFIVHGSSPATTGTIITAFGIAANLIIALLLVHFRGHSSVRATQPTLVAGMGVASAGLCATNLLFIGEGSDMSCILRVVLFNLCFDMVYGVLWAKIFRIQRIYSGARKLKRVRVPIMDLMAMTCGIVSIDLILLLAWAFADPPTPTVTGMSLVELPAPGVGELPITTCTSAGGIFGLLTLAFKVGLVLSACALVFASKNVPSTYVEHKFVAFSVYNTCVFSGVIALLTHSSEDPSTAFVSHCVGTSLGSLIVVGTLSLPSLLLVSGFMSAVSTTTRPSKGGGTTNMQNATRTKDTSSLASTPSSTTTAVMPR